MSSSSPMLCLSPLHNSLKLRPRPCGLLGFSSVIVRLLSRDSCPLSSSCSLAPIPRTLSRLLSEDSGLWCTWACAPLTLPPRFKSATIALRLVLSGLASNGPGIEVRRVSRSAVAMRRIRGVSALVVVVVGVKGTTLSDILR